MSRKSRRLRVRAVRAAALLCGAAFLVQRWRLRSFGLQCASDCHPTSFSSTSTTATTSSEAESSSAVSLSTSSRSKRWEQLAGTTPDAPLDLLVIGGGLTGLYTAVDAAQRGLRVGLVEAADLGAGSTTSHMPTISPGGLPYVQRAIRQRDTTWLRVAMTVMAEETTWANVASTSVRAPESVLQQVRSGVRRVASRWSGASGSSGGVEASGCAEAAPTMLLPALHSSEMLEYACAAVLGTFLSAFCGPLRPTTVLSTSAMEARLPALARGGESSSASSASASVRVKGGVATGNICIDGHAAAVSLAATAAELGVVLCSYAPVVQIKELPAESDASLRVRDGYGSSRWRLGASAKKAGGGEAPPVMVALVRDALAHVNDALPSPSAAPVTGTSSWLSRWFACRTTAAEQHSVSPSSSNTVPTAVYARCIVNCAGCGVDAVKSRYDGNTQDTVPAAFAGFLAYSYLVAPADGVHAVDAAQGVPLSRTLHASGLHISSPRLSYASTMVLPWRDRCVLLGPSITPLAYSPSVVHGSTGGEKEEGAAQDSLTHAVDGVPVIQSKDGYTAQRDRVLLMLASCGVTADAARLLSCVSQTVPCLKGPKEVPFQRELLSRGYALHFSSRPRCEAASDNSGEAVAAATAAAENRRVVPLLHVYGGTPVLARRIAEDAVDAVVRHPALANNTDRTSALHGCRTHRLRLSVPRSVSAAATANASPSHEAADGRAAQDSALTRLEALIQETYAERLTDVVARRTHVAYTSPEDAVRALPTIAAVMGKLKGWSAAREAAEVAAARRLIASVAVAAPSAAS